MEQSRVQFGSTEIPYTIVRGRREKTVAVGVDPVEGVRVRPPQETPVPKLDEIVRSKAKWIMTRRRRIEDLAPPPSPREFVSSESFSYLGRQYRLKLEHASEGKTSPVRLVGRYFRVTPADGEVLTEAVKQLLIDWYRGRAQHRLPERVAIWAATPALEPHAVLIRDQHRRWGSADRSQIVRLNWRLVQAPLRLVDYVVAHELMHLRYPNHTSHFWATLGQAMQDYEERREALRRIGPEMVW